MTDTESAAGPLALTPTIHQVASIVRDLDVSVARLQQTMGWGPWDVYEYVPGRLRDLTVRGQPAEFSWIGAEVAIGPEMYVELLQPTSPSGIFHEWLSTRGEGMHHVGYWAPSVPAAQDLLGELTADGTEVLLSAWIDDVYFYYLDTHPMIYEVWAGDPDSLSPVRQIRGARRIVRDPAILSAGALSPPVGVITGGVSGIGAATAVEFAGLGARLVLLDISAGAGDEVESRVRAAGGEATTIGCDVADAGAVQAAITSAVEHLGGLDFIVANAGIAEQSLIATGDPQRWAAVVTTNLLGAMNTSRAALPVMRRQGHGHVLIVASVSGREAYVGEPAYIASKWGLVGFAHALRIEAAGYGVRVTVVEPGSVATPLTMDNPLIRPLMDTIEPLAPQDVARCLVFAYQQPAHVVISELVIRPLSEATNDLPGFADAQP